MRSPEQIESSPSHREAERPVNYPRSIVVVGALGATGQMFMERLAQSLPPGTRLEAAVRPSQLKTTWTNNENNLAYCTLEQALYRRPEFIILATTNPAQEALQSMAAQTRWPTTLVLPQNGVEIVPSARQVLADRNVSLVRASLFTTVGFDGDRKAKYDASKMRIGLAGVPADDHTVFDGATHRGLLMSRAVLEQGGFAVKIFPDYLSLEWTKLVVNGVGATGVITGLGAEETFANPDLFNLEARALKDRLHIMRLAGIAWADIPWQHVGWLAKLQHIPTAVLRPVRSVLGSVIAHGRHNAPPAAALKIAQGKPTETTYYHLPFVALGAQFDYRSPVDEAILQIMQRHNRQEINLNQLSPAQRQQLLLTTYASLI
jgi:ketopantoate reductase